jgi:lipid-A-disaccharide synthase
LLDVLQEKAVEKEQAIGDPNRFIHLSGKPVVALLPGSRKQEIKNMLPAMLAAARNFPDCRFVVGGAPSVPDDFYRPFLDPAGIPLAGGPVYGLLRAADAAVVTSGTATLEAALMDTPELVCYKGNFLSYLLARKLVRVPFISLVNLVLGKPAVRELIQQEMTAANIARELNRLLHEPGYRNAQLEQFRLLREKLGRGGASRKTAAEIVRRLTDRGN